MPQSASKAEVEARIREAGKRAAVEADERRKTMPQDHLPPEIDGPKGLEPTRYGDWEKNGIASDF